MGDLSEHFDRSEFACPCGCGFGFEVDDVAPQLVALLEDLRARAGGLPVHVTSGCRCASRNRQAGGVRNSQHLRGTAADIVVRDMHPGEVADLAESMLPMGGVGRYDTSVHVDVRGHRARWDMRSNRGPAPRKEPS